MVDKSLDIFHKAYEETLGFEGGYSNDSDDRGKETYKGISRKNFPDWEGWELIDSVKDHEDFPNILSNQPFLKEMCEDFYYTNFYKPLKLDKINSEKIIIEIFDSAVNCGKSASIKFVQRACNFLNRNNKLFLDLVLDGIIGDVTIKAINLLLPQDEISLWKSLNGEQYVYYREITERNPEQEKYSRGWLKRIF